MDVQSGRPLDTTPGAWQAQLESLRAMSGSQRVGIALQLTELAREASRAGIRSRHPDYDEEEVRQAFFRMLHGDQLTRSVWPGRELLDP